jgi:hypothetical protein
VETHTLESVGVMTGDQVAVARNAEFVGTTRHPQLSFNAVTSESAVRIAG